MSMKNRIERFLKEEEGQSTIEYILMLAIVVMIAMKFKGLIMNKMETLVGKVSGQIDEATQN